jgi:hypothetical protein
MDNEKIFQTEDIGEIQEKYEDSTYHFSSHTYEINNKYRKFAKELWGKDYEETFNAIYGDDLKQFKEDYAIEIEDYFDIGR